MAIKRLLQIIAFMTLLCVGFAVPSFGKDVRVGNAMSSWLGKGEIHEIGNERVLFHGALEGVIFSRQHQGTLRSPMHAAKMRCPVEINFDKNTNHRESQGFCVITPNDDSGKVYVLFQCSGSTSECKGEWKHIGGTGRFVGISGTSPFRSRIDIGPSEKEQGPISGYAVWPDLAYQLP